LGEFLIARYVVNCSVYEAENLFSGFGRYRIWHSLAEAGNLIAAEPAG